MAPRRVRKFRPYPKELLEPIRVNPEQGSTLGCVLQGAFERLEALCEHYKIPNDADKWCSLALALPFDHVPAFRIADKKSGRKPSAQKLAEDVMLFTELTRADLADESVNEAACNLVKRSGRFNGRSPEGLRQRYYRIRYIHTPEGERMYRFLATYPQKECLKKSCKAKAQPLCQTGRRRSTLGAVHFATRTAPHARHLQEFC